MNLVFRPITMGGVVLIKVIRALTILPVVKMVVVVGGGGKGR